MRLQDLADVHAARHAERIEHDIDRRTVGEERHVLGRHDLRHHALIAMATGHLVAGLDLALHGDEDLDHFHHAGRQLIATLQLFDFVEEALFEALLRFSYCFRIASISAMILSFGEANIHHCERGYSSSTARVSWYPS